MNASCDYCTGSRWLGDVRGNGACLCAPLSQILIGDCRHHMAAMGADSVDAIVCDPPYGLSKEPDMVEVLRHWLAGDDYAHASAGFMGKTWDSFVPGPAVWREAYRVLKPGGHLVAFFGTRTYDMGVLAIRLAGFEIRDQIGWAYGSGFPKSHDVSKGIDASLGAVRQVIGTHRRHGGGDAVSGSMSGPLGTASELPLTAPATPEAEQWEGWGTALKPALEPIVIARKPLSESSVARNVMRRGTGALNIDGCRVHTDDSAGRAYVSARTAPGAVQDATGERHLEGVAYEGVTKDGRWPANLIHDGSDEVLTVFPDTKSGGYPPEGGQRTHVSTYGAPNARGPAAFGGSEGSAARFFYCAKASTRDREEGLEALAKVQGVFWQTANGASGQPSSIEANRPPRAPRTNNHPTVKPTDLMAYLCRLVTPPGGVVLDPFMGSGSTGKAARREGFGFIGIELDPDYAAIARGRIDAE